MRARRMLAAAAAAVVVAAGAAVAVLVDQPAAHASGVCTDPSIVFHGQDSQGLGDYYADADIWNPEDITQTMGVCSRSSWFVDVTANDTGDGAVQSYPNVHRDYHNWGSGGGDTESLNQVGAIDSSFAHSAPDAGTYDVAYDIWLNGVADNDSTELMIWTQNRGQTPAGSKHATVTIAGHAFDLWYTSDHQYVAYVAQQTITSGSWDLKAFTDDMVNRSLLNADATFGQVDYGVEVVDTAGAKRHFDFTDFSVDVTTGSPSSSPTSPSPTSASPTPTKSASPTPTDSSPPPSTPPAAAGKLLAGRVLTHPYAHAAESTHVAFPPGSFDAPPVVEVTAWTSMPYTAVKAVSVKNVTADGFDVVIYRTDTVKTTVFWMASPAT